jgi:hypothetical protein
MFKVLLIALAIATPVPNPKPNPGTCSGHEGCREYVKSGQGFF